MLSPPCLRLRCEACARVLPGKVSGKSHVEFCCVRHGQHGPWISYFCLLWHFQWRPVAGCVNCMHFTLGSVEGFLCEPAHRCKQAFHQLWTLQLERCSSATGLDLVFFTKGCCRGRGPLRGCQGRFCVCGPLSLQGLGCMWACRGPLHGVQVLGTVA